MGPLRPVLAISRLTTQTALLALQQIWANKVRSLLTTLGIVIGVASIIAVVASLSGLRQNVLSEFEKFGTNKVFVDGERPDSMRNQISWRDVQLKLEEVVAIREHCPSIVQVAPMYYNAYAASYGDRRLDGVQAIGIWPQWHDIEGRDITQGRPFNAIDEQERRSVCIVNDQAIKELSLPSDPVGEFIMLSGRRFLIVGVVETIQFSGRFGGGDTETEVFIPFATARQLNPDGWINHAIAQLAGPEKVEDAKAEIGYVLRTVRDLGPDDEATFEVRVVQQFIDGFNRLAAGITVGAAGIVSIALLVGGIGIMNIMLVSVSERTREIGLRKAMGARAEVIMIQFLVEAVTLSLLGGALGLAIGQLMVEGMRRIPNAPLESASVPVWAVALSVGFSAATGIVFGMFPAMKAARLDPIEALRHE